MNIETMKSLVLVILIAFSLVLTLGLWNYQPVTEPVDEDSIVENTKLENLGKESSMVELAEPDKIVFHEQGAFYSYKDNGSENAFYKRMQEWNLTNLAMNPGEVDFENHENMIEIIFPTSLPLKVVGDIFKVDPEQIEGMIPENFDRIFLLYHYNQQPPSSYQVWFVNSEGNSNKALLRASINASVGERAFSELDNKDSLVEQIRLADAFPYELSEVSAEDHIYIPKTSPSLPEVVLQADSIPLTPLQNDLFPPTSVITKYKINEGNRIKSYEGRRLDQLDNARRMEFEYMIPNEANPSNPRPYELFRRSIEDVNSHMGWTNDFQVDSISSDFDSVEYRMQYNNLSVMESEDTKYLATLYLKYEQGVIQQYTRPLIKFKTYTEPEGEVESGKEVVEYLLRSDLNLNNIQDIQIRYTLKEQSSNLAYSLLPEWYIKTAGSWSPLFNENLERSQNEKVS